MSSERKLLRDSRAVLNVFCLCGNKSSTKGCSSTQVSKSAPNSPTKEDCSVTACSAPFAQHPAPVRHSASCLQELCVLPTKTANQNLY